MNKSTEGWIHFSKTDLDAAKSLLKNNDELSNIVLFHCQQCLEKIFKAVLENYAIRIPRVHSLERIYADLPDELKKTVDIDESFINLIDDIYISSRYPIDMGLLPTGHPTKEEATEIFQKTEKLFNDILLMIKK